jgi:hypothetical protein
MTGWFLLVGAVNEWRCEERSDEAIGSDARRDYPFARSNEIASSLRSSQ